MFFRLSDMQQSQQVGFAANARQSDMQQAAIRPPWVHLESQADMNRWLREHAEAMTNDCEVTAVIETPNEVRCVVLDDSMMFDGVPIGEIRCAGIQIRRRVHPKGGTIWMFSGRRSAVGRFFDLEPELKIS